MAIDVEQIRELMTDLDEADKSLVLLQRRVRMIKRDLLIAIGDRKPVVQRIDAMTNPDGSKTDLKKYRFS